MLPGAGESYKVTLLPCKGKHWVLELCKAVDTVTILKDTYTNVSQTQGNKTFEWHLTGGCFS